VKLERGIHRSIVSSIAQECSLETRVVRAHIPIEVCEWGRAMVTVGGGDTFRASKYGIPAPDARDNTHVRVCPDLLLFLVKFSILIQILVLAV
jgi:hypothetical protein